MPDPNNPDALTPPDPAMDPTVAAEPVATEQEVEAPALPTNDPAFEPAYEPAYEAEDTGPPDKSSIQGAMEGALDRSLAAAQGSGDDDIPLKTYPISAKMRARLTNEFTYHAPRQDQVPRYNALRSMALTFATMVVELTPPSREQSLALTKLSEAIMHANAAIARDEEVPF